MEIKKVSLAIVLIILFLPILLSAQTQDSSELRNIFINKSEDQLEERFEIQTPVNYESFTLFNPNRLIVDLLQISNFSCEPEIDVNDFGVIRIRTGKNQSDVTRVVFDLGEEVPSYSIEEQSDGIFLYFKVEKTAAEQPEVKPLEKPIQEVEKKAEPEAKKKAAETKPKAKIKTPPKVEETWDKEGTPRGKTISINFGGGLYFVQSSDFQDVYGKSAISFGGGLGFSFPLSSREDLGIALDVTSLSASGETTYTQEEVKLTLMPLSISIFYQRHIGKLSPFAGLGFSSISYKETYPETFAIPETKGSVIGYNLFIGTDFKIIPSLAVKIFFKLHSAKKTENEMDINLSGNQYGIGLSYYFNL